MPANIIPDRIRALCDWIERGDPKVPFNERPDYEAHFGNISDVELLAIETEMRRRVKLTTNTARRLRKGRKS